MYTKSKFEKELTYNRGEIKKHADRLRIDFSQQQVSQKEQAESWAESDYETRIALSTDPNFGLRTISDESRPFYSAIPSPYFLHTKDGNSYSYISNDITFSNILKYTTARASYLRYNGEERQYLEIDGDIINVSIDTNNQIEESGEGLLSIIPSNLYEKKREQRVISNISDTLLQEQDQTIRTPSNSNTLITGPAGSGKTNTLLHRIDYLISEEDIAINNIALFCFNVGLKKYLDQSMDAITKNKPVIISFDQWREKVIKATMTGRTPTINYKSIEQLGSDSKVDKFIDELGNKLNPRKIKDSLYRYFSFTNGPKISRDVLDKLWEDRAIGCSTIGRLFIVGKYLVDEICEYEKSRVPSIILDSIRRQGSSAVSEFYKKIRKNLEEILSQITLKCIGYNYSLGKFELDELIKIWNKENSTSINIENFESEKFRSQITYLIKELSNQIPDNIFYGLWKSKRSKDEMDKEELFRSFDHILVDEFQDLQPHQLNLIKKFSKQGITLAGDLTQSIYLEPSKKEIKFPFEIHHTFRLSVTHRSTLETIQFANALLKGGNKNYDRSQKYMHTGEKPLVCKLSNSNKLGLLVKNAMTKYPTSSFLITAFERNSCEKLHEELKKSGIKEAYIAEKDTWDFNKNIHISTYHQAKGLEFDFVIITGLGDFLNKTYIHNKENLIYMILTRSKKRVIIAHSGEKDIENILKGIDANLFEAQNY